ncbi:MAG: methyltransferase domain-containing protein [Sphingobacteriaceae bacterium]|nr:MAG: methyltransferase domain-containing protein [Sphingobacteriaceae bacterium]
MMQWDFGTSVEEVMRHLHTLVMARQVLYLGISDTPAWVVVKANAFARQHGLTPFSVYQGKWNAGISYKNGVDMLENISYKSYRNAGNEDVLEFITGNGKVLDIGCGGGDNARVLKERGFEVDGITISERELKEANPFLRAGYLYNLENGLPETVLQKKYDYIICSHVLEHVCYPEKLLKDILSCLALDGRLIVALPNLFHYKSRWELVKGNFNYQSAGIWDNTHVKWYSYKTGARLLEEHGFKIEYKSPNKN